MEKIRWACPECGKKLSASEDKAGKTGRCPGCAAVVQVPMPTPSEGGVEKAPNPERSEEEQSTLSERSDNILTLLDFLANVAERFAGRVDEALRVPHSDALLFEVRLYFLHLLYVEMFTSWQPPAIRALVLGTEYRVLGSEFAESLGTAEEELIKIAQQRQQEYIHLFSSRVGDNDYFESLHSRLSMYARAALRSGRVALSLRSPLRPSEDLFFLTPIQEAERVIVSPFRVALHDLFAGSQDFTQLDSAVFVRRLLCSFDRASWAYIFLPLTGKVPGDSRRSSAAGSRRSSTAPQPAIEALDAVLGGDSGDVAQHLQGVLQLLESAGPGFAEVANSRVPTITETTPAATPEQLERFASTIRAADAYGRTIRSARVTGFGGHTVEVVAGNDWVRAPYGLRLEFAQQIWAIWARIHSRNPHIPKLRLVSEDGRKLGGSRFWAGPATWVRK